jgi:opacity protein-like surface antigen
MKSLCTLLVLLALPLSLAAAADDATADGWITMFDGKTLDGWKANEAPECWTVEDGCLKGSGGKSHLFYMQREFTDCEFKADIKLDAGSNSGMYFRTAFGPGFPKGYEAQVNNSHKDPKRTGTLYHFVVVEEQLVPDDTWWNQHIIAKGNHIEIQVNGKTVVNFVDDKNTFKKGYLALQQHDPKSIVWYKNLQVKPLD